MTNDIFLIRLGAILQQYFSMRPGYEIIYMPRHTEIKYFHNEKVSSVRMQAFIIDTERNDDVLAAYAQDANVLFISPPESVNNDT
jgi:hypothetical protein